MNCSYGLDIYQSIHYHPLKWPQWQNSEVVLWFVFKMAQNIKCQCVQTSMNRSNLRWPMISGILTSRLRDSSWNGCLPEADVKGLLNEHLWIHESSSQMIHLNKWLGPGQWLALNLLRIQAIQCDSPRVLGTTYQYVENASDHNKKTNHPTAGWSSWEMWIWPISRDPYISSTHYLFLGCSFRFLHPQIGKYEVW